MSNQDVYRQCKLTKKAGKATLHHVAWIPNAFAEVGQRVSLRHAVGEGRIVSFEGWDSGWVVAEVYGARYFGELRSLKDTRNHQFR
jgi:hypothetical protein